MHLRYDGHISPGVESLYGGPQPRQPAPHNKHLMLDHLLILE